MFGLAERADALLAKYSELAVGNGDNHRVVGAGLRFNNRRDAVFVLRLGGVNPGVVNVGGDVVFPQFLEDVDHPGVAQVRAVFLEGEAHDQHAGAVDVDAAPGHRLDQLRDDVGAHAVVEAAAGEDDLGVVADRLRLVREVVRIDTDAVAADQAGPERQEIPLAAGSLQHGFGVDAHPVEDEGEFVYQCDVDVALGVLDDLGRFGNLDARRLVGAGGDDLVVEGIDEGGDLGRQPGGDFPDGGDTVFLVAGVDPLRAVAGEKVNVEREAGGLLQHRHAVFLGGAGVNGGFVDDDIAPLENLADGLAGLDQRGQVGALVFVDRGRHGNDEDVAGAQAFAVRRAAQMRSGPEFFRLDFEGVILAGLQLGDTPGIDVEADDRTLLAELHRQRQTDVAEADDGEVDFVEGHECSGSTVSATDAKKSVATRFATARNRTSQLDAAAH